MEARRAVTCSPDRPEAAGTGRLSIRVETSHGRNGRQEILCRTYEKLYASGVPATFVPWPTHRDGGETHRRGHLAAGSGAAVFDREEAQQTDYHTG